MEALIRDLVGDAYAYTERGLVCLGVRVTDSRAELEVRDTGAGIAPVEPPRCFDGFYRRAASRRLAPPRAAAPGSGLGLAIARRIAEAHGGAGDLSPASGGGTVARAAAAVARSA